MDGRQLEWSDDVGKSISPHYLLTQTAPIHPTGDQHLADNILSPETNITLDNLPKRHPRLTSITHVNIPRTAASEIGAQRYPRSRSGLDRESDYRKRDKGVIRSLGRGQAGWVGR